MIFRYAFLAALTAALALGGVVWWQSGRLDRLEGMYAAQRLLHESCEARLSNIRQDKESDDAIDRIPDDGLRHVPDDWLLPL